MSIQTYAQKTELLDGLIAGGKYFICTCCLFVNWCNNNFLSLNVKKTKEMVIDFRVNKYVPDPIVIASEQVERVKEYKYLGMIIDDKLSGSPNSDKVYKTCQQRIHFLRILGNIRVDKGILSMFYKSVVESILSFSITVWYGKLSWKDKNKMKRIVKKEGKLKSSTVPLEELYNCNVMKQVHKIMNDVDHPLNCQYTFLRSGKRLALPMQHTSRFKNTFVPKSIKLYNYFLSSQ